jgi:hypothetical protein
MASDNSLETRRIKDSYEIRRNNEIVFYFRKDVVPRWLGRLFWTLGGAVVTIITILIPHLFKILVG